MVCVTYLCDVINLWGGGTTGWIHTHTQICGFLPHCARMCIVFSSLMRSVIHNGRLLVTQPVFPITERAQSSLTDLLY
ncbi:hypothetical protein E2C01_093983 [Portunus trituberculatus]|uniref:Uncharacterized protein n=1 Tax=Portunus trituberculatus TaxID=210409 RepID=A0A5B7JUZ5_PORTR|nr:hypothetical protein [Portunus trituberculatus]